MEYYHYFIAVDRTETMEGFSLAHFTGGASSGIGGLSEMKMEHYTWKRSGFDILSCKEFELKKHEIHDTDIGPIMLRLSDVIGDRHYDPVRYNCEHVANYVMSGKLESNQSNSCKARCCSVIIMNTKGVVLFVSALICFMSAASGTIVRRAYEKLLVGLFLASKERNIANSTYPGCEDYFGENIIKSARTLLTSQTEAREHYESIDGNFKATIEELILELNSTSICKVASNLGKEAFIQTCLFTVVPLVMLQTIYILCRIYYNLIPAKKSFATRNLKFAFAKEIGRDVIGGLFSSIFMVGFGFIVEIYFIFPAFAYFFLVAFSGIVGRWISLLIFEIINHCCHKVPNADPQTQTDSACFTCCCGGGKLKTGLCLLLPAALLALCLSILIVILIVCSMHTCTGDLFYFLIV